MGVGAKGFNERLGNRWRTLGALFIARATCREGAMAHISFDCSSTSPGNPRTCYL